MPTEQKIVWVLTEWTEDDGDTVWVHETEIGALRHMQELSDDRQAEFQDAGRTCERIHGPDSPMPTWYLCEPHTNLLVDDYYAHWTIERQQMFA